MNGNKDARLFLALAAPFCLIGVPVFFAYVGYATVRDLLADKSPELFEPKLAAIVLLMIPGYAYAYWYCKRELGWFQGKGKGKPEL